MVLYGKPELIDGMRAARRETIRSAEDIRAEHYDFRPTAERVEMPDGASQSRFELLLGMKEHEVHHRAQLTVLKRLAGAAPDAAPGFRP